MALDVDERLERARRPGFGIGLLKGMAVLLKHLFKRNTVIQYPEVKQDLSPRTRGVIALKEENCTVCMLCARECPDWCIYIDSHKEQIPAKRQGGRPRKRNVLDRFAIDYALCMYCGICVEVCPYDALFWSREFEYAEYDIRELTHEKEKLSDWMASVLPPPGLKPGATLPGAPPPAPTTTHAPRRPRRRPRRHRRALKKGRRRQPLTPRSRRKSRRTRRNHCRINLRLGAGGRWARPRPPPRPTPPQPKGRPRPSRSRPTLPMLRRRLRPSPHRSARKSRPRARPSSMRSTKRCSRSSSPEVPLRRSPRRAPRSPGSRPREEWVAPPPRCTPTSPSPALTPAASWPRPLPPALRRPRSRSRSAGGSG